jgi:lysozyme
MPIVVSFVGSLIPAVKLIKQFEGFSPTVYICPAGKPTIGYGKRCDPNHPAVTEEEASKDLEEMLLESSKKLTALLASQAEKITDNQFNALLSLMYNIGYSAFKSSTLLSLLLKGDMQNAGENFKRWVYSGNDVLPGLVRRRTAEYDLFVKS